MGTVSRCQAPRGPRGESEGEAGLARRLAASTIGLRSAKAV